MNNVIYTKTKNDACFRGVFSERVVSFRTSLYIYCCSRCICNTLYSYIHTPYVSITMTLSYRFCGKHYMYTLEKKLPYQLLKIYFRFVPTYVKFGHEVVDQFEIQYSVRSTIFKNELTNYFQPIVVRFLHQLERTFYLHCG